MEGAEHSSLCRLTPMMNILLPQLYFRSAIFTRTIFRVMTAPRDLQDLLSKDEHVLQAVSDEGLFEAARLASPILPQYHPKQLIELLNSGKTRKVKAILLHVLNCLKVISFS